MFSRLWNIVMGVIKKMLGPQTIAQALNIVPVVSSDMAKAIERWYYEYKDRAIWIREPTIDDPVRIVSLGLPAFISSEKARMATLEMKSEINLPKPKETSEENSEDKKEAKGSSERADFLNEIYKKKVLDRLRPNLEIGLAGGGLVMKPYISKKADGTQDIDIEFIYADAFYPLSFNSVGKVIEAAFVQTVVDKDITYRRLEYHRLVGNKIIVKNKAFRSQNPTNNINLSQATELGVEVPLKSLPEWADIEAETTIENVDKLLFAYFKNPEANIIDPLSPLGMSCFGRAESLIKDADYQYSRLLWEFEATEAALDVDRDALKEEKGFDGKFHTTKPHFQERFFRKLDLGSDDTYNQYNPAIRDESLINGLNSILMRIEDVCALSRGTLSTASIEAKTATELKILKQRSYAVNADIQHALELALKDLIYSIDVLCTLYNISPEGKYEVSFEWDDSILVDIEEELKKRIQLVQQGISSKLEMRMWYFGETEGQAKEALERIGEENRKSMEENAKLQALIAQDTYMNNNSNMTDKSLPASTNSVKSQVRNNIPDNSEKSA